MVPLSQFCVNLLSHASVSIDLIEMMAKTLFNITRNVKIVLADFFFQYHNEVRYRVAIFPHLILLKTQAQSMD